MIAAAVLSASALSGTLPLEEIEAEARFCLSLPSRPDAFKDLLALRERGGWQLESAGKNGFDGKNYAVHVYRANGREVSAAFASADEPAFCRYSVAVSVDDVQSSIEAVRQIYLTRAAVVTINPYEFGTGVGERVVVETIPQADDLTELRFTVSTTRATTPF